MQLYNIKGQGNVLKSIFTGQLKHHSLSNPIYHNM